MPQLNSDRFTAVQRRRQHQNQQQLISAIAAVSIAIIVVFFSISFLTPTFLENDRFYHARKNNGVGGGNQNKIPVFQVPNTGGGDILTLWSAKNAQLYYGCSNASTNFSEAAAVTQADRYLVIAASGGLNQQRTGITDAVVAARIVNATLIVPKLDARSFWNDASNFSDIFDVDWFISFPENDVKIIKELPQRKGREWKPHTIRIPRLCSQQCYIDQLLPMLSEMHAVQLSKFDYRLSNSLPTDLQKLRCRVNYHALRFTRPILEMGAKLVQRMRNKSKLFIALHLRFEPDMLAFSGCYYGGGDKERQELTKLRQRWRSLHKPKPERQRRQGRCPLTPEEVGLLLRALGYDRQTHVYVASGEVYGGEDSLGPLKVLFPNFYSKETLASPEELEAFSPYSSRMAALDFIVCDESDAFVTNNNGNMAKILAGRRRYFGHKPTIRPNAKKLYKLFLSRHNMTWEEFASSVNKFQKGFMGEPMEIRPGWGGFHENPAACICEYAEGETKTTSFPKESGNGSLPIQKRDMDAPLEDQKFNEQVWPEIEGEDDQRLFELLSD